MRTSSCKAKGRRLCQEVMEMYHRWFPQLRDGDIEITSSGVTGVDLKMSPAARDLLPFCHEMKNQEALSIWSCIKQAESHAKGSDLTPLLYFRRNNHKIMVCLSAEDFMKILKERTR